MENTYLKINLQLKNSVVPVLIEPETVQ